MSEHEIWFKDLDPDDYELLPKDYSIFDSCTDTSGPYKDLNSSIWYSDLPDPHIEPYIIFSHIMTLKNPCDKEGVMYIGEFFRYTCPGGEHYQNLSEFAKQLTNELVGRVHRHKVIGYGDEVVYAALKFSGCHNKHVVHISQEQDRRDFPEKYGLYEEVAPVFDKEYHHEYENEIVAIMAFFGGTLVLGCGFFALGRYLIKQKIL